MPDVRRLAAGPRRGKSRHSPLASPATLFIVRLALYWAAAWTLMEWLPAIQARAIQMTSWSLYSLLHLLRPDATISGALVAVGGASLEIVSECTPLVPALLLMGAVAAYPSAPKSKAIGLVVTLACLWLVNLLRLLVLIVILQKAPGWFDFAHVYLWQTVTVLAAAALFAGWIRWTSRPVTA
jgi:exosortase/archaeosortase family protein